MRKLKWFIFALIYPWLTPPAVLAETPPPHAKVDQAMEKDVSIEVVVKRVTEAMRALQAVASHYSELLREETELRGQIEEKTVEQAALRMPQAPDREAERATDTPEEIQILIETWEARDLALEQKAALQENRRDLLERHGELCLRLDEESRLLSKALEKYENLQQNLQNHSQQAQINEAELPPELVEFDPAPLNKLLAAGRDWRAAAARDELLLAEINDSLPLIETQREQVKTALTETAGRLQLASRKADLRGEWVDKANAELLTLFTTRWNAWLEDYQAWLGQLRDMQVKIKEIAEMERALAQAAPPEPPSLEKEENSPESLYQARLALAQAEAMSGYRREHLAQINALHDALEQNRQNLDSVSEQADELHAVTLELDVAAEIIQERAAPRTEPDKGGEGNDKPAPPPPALPEVIANKSLWGYLDTLRFQYEALGNLREAESERLKEIVKIKEQAEESLKLAEKNLLEKQREVERERQWASFLAEVQSLDDTELLARFEQTSAAFEETAEPVRARMETLAAARTQLNSAREEYQSIRESLVLEYSSRRQRFVDWLKEQGLFIEPPAEEQEPGGESEKALDGEATSPEKESADPVAAEQQESEKAQVSDPSQLLLQSLQKRRDGITRELDSLREKLEARKVLSQKLEATEQALGAAIEQLENRVDLARRAWGAATTLTQRASTDQEKAALPISLEDWNSRERIFELQKKLGELQRELEAMVAEREQLAEKSDKVLFIPPLQALRESLTRQLNELNTRIQKEEEYERFGLKDVKRSEFEQRLHERELQERIRRDQELYESVLLAVVGHHTEDTNQLLWGYYEKLLILEKRRENLETREQHTETLIELTEDTRPLMRELEPLLEEELKNAETRLAVERARVEAALFPARGAEVLAKLQEERDITLESGDIPTLPAGLDERAAYEARRELVENLLEDWARVAGYRDRLEQIRAAHAELGRIDTEIDAMKDTISHLEAKKEDLRHQIAFLIGYPRAELAKLPAEDRPSGESLKAFFKGKIGLLREERLHELYRAALRTAVWLVIIPLIAFLIIKIVNFIGYRKLSRLSRRAEEQGSSQEDLQEKEERFKILFHVFRTALVIVISLLTIIYMFKVINVDVLPLLASAGVLGLAFAFGAQQLVRDFFSGFFILLENQFKSGDYVTIDGVRGTVQKLSPRLTMLRDAQGGVHYFPNGGISTVINHSREWEATIFEIPVAYDTPLDKARKCVWAVKNALFKHPDYSRVLRKIDISDINDFKDYAMTMRVMVTALPDEPYGVAREFRRRVKQAFDQAGIEMPRRMLFMPAGSQTE